MIIALASPAVATSLDAGLEKIKRFLSEASAQGAAVVCFPEAYLPGLRGVGIDVLPFGPSEHARVLREVADYVRTYAVTAILGTERLTDAGRQIAAYVFDAQAGSWDNRPRTRSTPARIPTTCRETRGSSLKSMGYKFGISICHEGWRYPETVRAWAAVRGAKIVFHPQHTGSDQEGELLTQWAHDRQPLL